MIFLPNSVTLGKVGFSSARVNEKGDVVFVVKLDGALITRIIPAGVVKPVFKAGETISYADECYMLDGGKIERRGEYYYAPD